MSQPQNNNEPNAATEEDLTYGDIVWGQFQKNGSANFAMYLLFGLIATAVFCPLIASDRPFIWTENGETTYPWFSSLFDRNYFVKYLFCYSINPPSSLPLTSANTYVRWMPQNTFETTLLPIYFLLNTQSKKWI